MSTDKASCMIYGVYSRSIQTQRDLVKENNQKLGRIWPQHQKFRQKQNEASFPSFNLQPIKNLVAAKPLLAGAHLIGSLTKLDDELDALDPAISKLDWYRKENKMK